MTRMTFKRGDTFSYFIDLTDAENSPLVLQVEDIKCQIRTKSGSLIDTLIIETTATNGKYLVSASDTTFYPVGTQEMDLKINENGIVASTETIEVVVEKDVTKWL